MPTQENPELDTRHALDRAVGAMVVPGASVKRISCATITNPFAGGNVRRLGSSDRRTNPSGSWCQTPLSTGEGLLKSRNSR